MKFDFYITGTIGVVYDWWLGQKGTTADQVKAFLDSHKDKELTIAVSSFGGYLDEGIAIGEYIKAHGNCHMVIIGMTASAATVLCMKAKSVRIAKGSMMLIHNSSMTLDVWTAANKQKIDEIITSFKKQRDDLDTFDKAIAQIYSSRNGKPLEEIMAKMDEEKWMLAEEALEFGIVDSIISDDIVQSQSKAVKNAYASHAGLPGHFGIPAIPMEDSEKIQSPGFFERLRAIGRDIRNLVKDDEEEHPEDHQPIHLENMKKIILNLFCPLLGVQDFTLNEKGETVLSEEQLNTVENALKAKDDEISTLKGERDAANTAKATAESERDAAKTAQKTAEDNLQNLQKEYDDFKKAAGGDSPEKTLDETKNPVTAKTLLNEVKGLM